MLTKIKLALASLALVAAGAGAVLAPAYVYADAKGEAMSGVNASQTGTAGDTAVHDTGTGSLDSTVKNIINGVLYVVGILAVVMVIIGGVQYTTSGGDSGAVTKAKNTILYGIVGLVIAILAYAIVNFVVGKL